jgi:predicted HicB family RNase H-like nuclease
MFKIQKGYDSESKTFRLPIELIERMGKLAEKNKISLNQLVIQCCKYALDYLEDDENNNKKP